MKFKNIQFTLFAIILVTLASCSNNNPIPPEPKRSQSDEIKPLAVGNYWKYKTTYPAALKLPDGNSDEKIWADTTLNGKNYFVANNISNNQYSYFCWNKVDGYYSSSDFSQEVFIKYPAKVGDEFVMNSSANIITKVLSINEKVTVEAGTFTCYHYQSQDSISNTDANGVVLGKYLNKHDTYYAVGVGMVLEIDIVLGAEDIFPRSRKELIEYSVK